MKLSIFRKYESDPEVKEQIMVTYQTVDNTNKTVVGTRKINNELVEIEISRLARNDKNRFWTSQNDNETISL